MARGLPIMDIGEILLIFVVIVLTFFLIIVGIQVLFILRDLRSTLSRLNKVLDDAAFITHKIKEPLVSLSGATLILRSLSSFLGVLKESFSSHEREQK